MATEYEPMQQVRKNFRISWYRCPIDTARLRELTTRSNLKGWFQSIGFLLLITLAALLTYSSHTSHA